MGDGPWVGGQFGGQVAAAARRCRTLSQLGFTRLVWTASEASSRVPQRAFGQLWLRVGHSEGAS